MHTNHKNNFYQKKIGIWGFGIVGRSALQYFDQKKALCIEILDTNPITIPPTKTTTTSIIQSKETLERFLQLNDYIIVSPGIPLHAYHHYAHKYISELDIIAQELTSSMIAITGTIGKTSITHLLHHIIKTIYPSTQAAGNIGSPMLHLIDNQPDHVILELSSFQLQQAQQYAPNLAIITNFYPNHLDHHQSLAEYLAAKCNILRFQKAGHQALLPLDLMQAITLTIPLRKEWSFFSPVQPRLDQLKTYQNHTIFYLHEQKVYTTEQDAYLFNLANLPPLTFDTNWLIIIAACKLYNINLNGIAAAVKTLQLPDHRLQKIGSWHGCNFYNDSKSTVWQATLQAVLAMNNKPTKLFLGGLSKGADRTPLLQALQHKNIEIYTFGKEADALALLCKKFTIPHSAHQDVKSAWQACIKNITSPCQVLFSPGGSSYDLFPDYQARGAYFTKLVHDFIDQRS